MLLILALTALFVAVLFYISYGKNKVIKTLKLANAFSGVDRLSVIIFPLMALTASVIISLYKGHASEVLQKETYHIVAQTNGVSAETIAKFEDDAYKLYPDSENARIEYTNKRIAEITGEPTFAFSPNVLKGINVFNTLVTYLAVMVGFYILSGNAVAKDTSFPSTEKYNFFRRYDATTKKNKYKVGPIAMILGYLFVVLISWYTLSISIFVAVFSFSSFLLGIGVICEIALNAYYSSGKYVAIFVILSMAVCSIYSLDFYNDFRFAHEIPEARIIPERYLQKQLGMSALCTEYENAVSVGTFNPADKNHLVKYAACFDGKKGITYVAKYKEQLLYSYNQILMTQILLTILMIIIDIVSIAWACRTNGPDSFFSIQTATQEADDQWAIARLEKEYNGEEVVATSKKPKSNNTPVVTPQPIPTHKPVALPNVEDDDDEEILDDDDFADQLTAIPNSKGG